MIEGQALSDLGWTNSKPAPNKPNRRRGTSFLIRPKKMTFYSERQKEV